MKTKMKFLLMVLLLGTTMSVFSQPPKRLDKNEVTPEAIAQRQTEKMTKELSLTSDQQTKIRAINLKYAQQREENMKNRNSGSGQVTDEERKQMREDAQKIKIAQDAEYKSVLTSGQYQAYQNNKAGGTRQSSAQKKQR